MRIEDYAVIGDTQTAALVANNGAIDWLCLPRFDSAASFAALLGTREHGRWALQPTAPSRCTSRRYRKRGRFPALDGRPARRLCRVCAGVRRRGMSRVRAKSSLTRPRPP
ncbi:MAG: trehalase-like domain-containing protein, partial [Acidimicrobiales bacterium]